MSPIFLISVGKTTTVNAHAFASLQKVRKVAPLAPCSTRSTMPLTHCAVPTCLLASANATQFDDGVLRAEQIPLIATRISRKRITAGDRMMAEALLNASSVLL